MYQVVIERRAYKSWQKLPKKQFNLILRELQTLEKFNQFHPNIKKLHKPLNGYRLRIGDFRILFTKDDLKKEIKVYVIGHRREVYRRG